MRVAIVGGSNATLPEAHAFEAMPDAHAFSTAVGFATACASTVDVLDVLGAATPRENSCDSTTSSCGSAADVP